MHFFFFAVPEKCSEVKCSYRTTPRRLGVLILENSGGNGLIVIHFLFGILDNGCKPLTYKLLTFGRKVSKNRCSRISGGRLSLNFRRRLMSLWPIRETNWLRAIICSAKALFRILATNPDLTPTMNCDSTRELHPGDDTAKIIIKIASLKFDITCTPTDKRITTGSCNKQESPVGISPYHAECFDRRKSWQTVSLYILTAVSKKKTGWGSDSRL